MERIHPRVRRRLAIIGIFVFLLLLELGGLYLPFGAPKGTFYTLKEDVWYESPPNDNNDFLTDLFVKRFGWHQLPPLSVQHMCFMGMLHHSERFVIRLSPEEFSDLKAHIDSELTQEPKQDPDYKPSFSKDAPGNHFVWWTPPSKNVFSFSLGPDQKAQAAGKWGTNGLWGGYDMEYDPETHLLYIEAGTV